MPHSGNLSALVRSSLFVSDLDRSRHFYQSIGLKNVYYEGGLDSASLSAALHVPEGTVCRCCILRAEASPNFGMIGLFELTDPAPAIIHHPAGAPRIGEIALVFYTRDLECALSSARDTGASWLADPITFTMPHRSQREVCLRDPDGVLINLVERDPAEVRDTRPALEIAASLSN